MGAKSKVLSWSSPVARSTKTVIDAAVEENARFERLCFIFIGATALVSLGVMIAGAVTSNGLIAISGAAGGAGVVGSLLAYLNSVRRDRVRLRLLEIAFAKAGTAQEAAAILREALGHPAKSEGKLP